MKHLLIVEPGFQIYKEHLVRLLSQKVNIKIYCAVGLDDVVSYEWLSKYVNFVMNFSYKHNNLLEEIQKFEVKHKIKFDGILTWIDTSLPIVNYCQHKLNLPTISLHNNERFQNKGFVRDELSRDKECRVFYKRIKTCDELDLIIQDGVNYPVIIKPTEMMASLGVSICFTDKELIENYNIAVNIDFYEENLRNIYSDLSQEVIVEEYIQGEEYSVESIVVNGETSIIGLTQKIVSDKDESFEEVGHVFPQNSLNNNVLSKVNTIVPKIHRLLKLNNTITHIEIKVLGDIVKVIEVNNRLAGDLISKIMNKQGVDVAQLLISTCLGLVGDVKKTSLEGKAPSWINYISTNQVGRIHNILCSDDSIIEMASNRDVLLREKEDLESRLAYYISTSQKNDMCDYSYTIQKPILSTRNKNNIPLLFFTSLKEDIEDLVQIESKAWCESQRASKEILECRIKNGQERFIVAYNGSTKKMIGYIHWVPINKSEAGNSWDYYADLSKERGEDFRSKHMYVVSLTVLPDAPIQTGKNLFLALEEYGKFIGIKTISCRVSPTATV